LNQRGFKNAVRAPSSLFANFHLYFMFSVRNTVGAWAKSAIAEFSNFHPQQLPRRLCEGAQRLVLSWTHRSRSFGQKFVS
jgi:hypothetical protein